MPDDDDGLPTPDQQAEYHRLYAALRADPSPENRQALERFVIDNRYGNEMGPADDPEPPAGAPA